LREDTGAECRVPSAEEPPLGTWRTAVGTFVLVLAAGQRQSTLKSNPIGYGGCFEVVVPSESLRFPGCTAYYCSLDHDRVKFAYFHTENDPWPDVLPELRAMDTLLIARGWKRDPQLRAVASLTTNARKAAQQVDTDTSIDRFRYVKGNRMLRAGAVWRAGRHRVVAIRESRGDVLARHDGVGQGRG